MISTIELQKRKEKILRILKSCALCPRECKVDRTSGRQGVCRSGTKAKIYSFGPHHGEEPILSGTHGSGTIFFSNCHMRCVYCQNGRFSQLGEGREISDERLAQIMLNLQAMRCHNINLVTPTHFLAPILGALCVAIEKNLKIPIVYNTGGYESADTLKLLDGIVDIYLVDARYGDDEAAKKYSGVDNYVSVNQAALVEMFRQVGASGMIVRHLVLPAGLAGTDSVMRFISGKLSKEVYISLMSQYHPAHRAADYPLINRRIRRSEYDRAAETLLKYNLSNGWIQAGLTEDVGRKFLGSGFESKA